MKLTVLVDNNTLIGRCYLGEPGLSLLIQEDGLKVLFDTGFSDAFIRNAHEMSIHLPDLNYLVLSHRHYDHTWGLAHLVKILPEVSDSNKPTLVTHPLTMQLITNQNLGKRDFVISQDSLSQRFNIQLSREPVWLSRNLVFLGKIERKNDFEVRGPISKIVKDNSVEDDYLLDDSAMAYRSERGLVIITGCSHSGICNIVEYAKKVCEEDLIIDIIGGFHLLNPPAEQLQGTLEYLKKLDADEVHACHCTDLNSKIALSKVANLKEVGVGLTLEYR